MDSNENSVIREESGEDVEPRESARSAASSKATQKTNRSKGKKHHVLERLQEIVKERQQLRKKNMELQRIISDMIDVVEPHELVVQEKDRDEVKLEYEYKKYLQNFKELYATKEVQETDFKRQIAILRPQGIKSYQEMTAEKSRVFEMFANFAVQARDENTGNPIPATDIESYLRQMKEKEATLTSVRVKYNQLKTMVEEGEKELVGLNTFGEGKQLIDFEQKKIENQIYKQKIEEGDEEICALYKGIVANIHQLTHMREKVSHFKKATERKKSEIATLDKDIWQRRKETSSALEKKEDFRRKIDMNIRKAGLLTSRMLLYDYQDCHKKLEINKKYEQKLMKGYTTRFGQRKDMSKLLNKKKAGYFATVKATMLPEGQVVIASHRNTRTFLPVK